MFTGVIKVLLDNDTRWKNLTIPKAVKERFGLDLKYQPSQSGDLNLFDWTLWARWTKEFTRDTRMKHPAGSDVVEPKDEVIKRIGEAGDRAITAQVIKNAWAGLLKRWAAVHNTI